MQLCWYMGHLVQFQDNDEMSLLLMSLAISPSHFQVPPGGRGEALQPQTTEVFEL